MQMEAVSESQPNWSTWAGFLRRHQLDDLVAWLLEAAGPFSILGAQALLLGGPLLAPAVSENQVAALAEMLEDGKQSRDFAAYLRKEAGH
jgi:hypothetical protein